MWSQNGFMWLSGRVGEAAMGKPPLGFTNRQRIWLRKAGMKGYLL